MHEIRHRGHAVSHILILITLLLTLSPVVVLFQNCSTGFGDIGASASQSAGGPRGQEGTGGVVLVSGNTAAAVVVLPAEPNQSESFAAQELVYHLKKSTGVELRLASETEISPDSGNFVYIGNCAETRRAGILVENFSRNEWLVRADSASPGALFLVGHDDPRNIYPKHMHSEAGTLYAVYDFLDQHLKVRWLWPGPLGEVIPRQSGIQVPYGTELRGTPKFLLSSFRINSTVDNFAAWTLPERRNAYMEDSILWLRRHRFAQLTAGQPTHSFRGYFSKYSASYPEIFNLLPEGTRRPDPTYFGGAYPELISMDVGAPKLVDLVIENWLRERNQPSAYFDANTYIDASENDTFGASVSPESLAMDVRDPSYNLRCLPDLRAPGSTSCASWDHRLENAQIAFSRGLSTWTNYLGSLTDRYARFMLRVQEKAKSVGSNAKVVGTAYANYVRPPVATRLNENIFIHYVPNIYVVGDSTPDLATFRNEWKGWTDSGAKMVYRPNHTLFGHNLPIAYAKLAGEAFRHAASSRTERGDRSMMGFDYDSLTGQFGTQGLTLYLIARQNMFPDEKLEVIMEEFYSGFGEYRAIVQEYFEFWEDVTRLISRSEYSELALTVPNGNANVFFYQIADKWFTPERMNQAKAILDRANQIATFDKENLDRIDFLKAGLKHVEATLESAKKYRQFVDGGRVDSTAFCQSLSALDAIRAETEGTHISNLGFLFNFESHIWRNGETAVNPPGAGELINGGFECGMAGWSFYPRVGAWNFTLHDRAGETSNGKRFGEMTCTQMADGSQSWGQLYRENLPIVPGVKYRLSAKVKTNPGFTGKIGLWIRSEGGTLGNLSLEEAGTNGEWKEIVLDGIVSQAKTASVYLNFLNGTGTLWFDEVRLIRMP